MSLAQRRARARAVHNPDGETNAEDGKDCCDDVSDDDGRWNDGDDHKGDWGPHGNDKDE